MKPIFKYALKLFIIMTIGMFLISVFDDYLFEDEIKISGILFKSLFFGLFMSITITLAQVYGVKAMGLTEITDDNLKAYSERAIESSLLPQQIIHKLQASKDFKIISSTNDKNSIELKSGLSFESWGEKIEIETIKNENNVFTYLIKSKPIIEYTLADYGKNKENVDKIINIINS